MLFKMFSLFLVLDVVGLFLSYVRAKQASYQASTKNFTVNLEKIESIIISVCGLIFGAVAIIIHETATVENGYYVWIGFALAAVFSVLFGIYSLKKITVSEDIITVSQILPFPCIRKYNFKNITHYYEYGSTLTVFNNKKKIFSLDSDMTGYQNMKKRLEEENIKFSQDGEKTKTVSKSWIITRNSNLLAIGGLFVGLGVIVGVVEAAKVFNESGIVSSLIMFFEIVGVMSAFFIVLAVFLLFPSYLHIRYVEKALNINFNEEMKKIGANRVPFHNKDWFITESGCIYSVIKIDLIKEVLSVDHNDDGGFYVIKVKTHDDKTIKIQTPSESEFMDWYKNRL